MTLFQTYVKQVSLSRGQQNAPLKRASKENKGKRIHAEGEIR